jgi:hypothetical protein
MKTIIVIPRELSSGRKFLNGFSVPAFFVKGNSLNVFRYRVPVNNTTEAINNKFKNNETGELLKKAISETTDTTGIRKNTVRNLNDPAFASLI